MKTQVQSIFTSIKYFSILTGSPVLASRGLSTGVQAADITKHHLQAHADTAHPLLHREHAIGLDLQIY